jgi:hypothetical protein
MAPLIPDGVTRDLVISFMLRLFYSGGKTSVPTEQEIWWVPEQGVDVLEMKGISCPERDSNPGPSNP